MFFVNGKNQGLLPVSDRSIQFGDGCFTTARIVNGCVSMIDAHLQRLERTCKALFIPFIEWNVLQMEMKELASKYFEGVLKVILTRGRSLRGYSVLNCLHPSRILSVSPYPDHYAHWHKSGITLTLSPIKLGRNPTLAGLKHLNRLEQVLIRTHLEKTNADEAIVLDNNGIITGCGSANIFWRRGKEVHTPRLNQAGINGIMRQFCLQKLENSAFHATEVSEDLMALRDAEEVIICNSLLPIAPVHTYGVQRWPIGNLYQFLAPLCRKIMVL